MSQLLERITLALAARAEDGLFDTKHERAFRLFNGFLEGCPDLSIDLYGKTLVLHDYDCALAELKAAQAFLLAQLPWVECVVIKGRGGSAEQRNGIITFGDRPDTKIREHGVRYAVDLLMNQDASLYLDTRLLRRWLSENMAGKTVLNTFAYTGSLGVAAMAGGAAHVVQTDLNKRFLNVAKTSYTLNGSPIDKKAFITGDFFPVIKQLNRASKLFDCVLIDPPFFAKSTRGSLDLARDSARLINKVRPLVKDQGCIVMINNGLFVHGQAFHDTLQSLCVDGYVAIEQLMPVSADFTGYPTTRRGEPVSDPAPFNHSTKIAILRIHHSPLFTSPTGEKA